MNKIKAMIFTSVNLLFSSYLGLAHSSSQMTNPNTSVVDVPMMLRGSSPAVEVMVNGQGPFLFTIDTGARGLARVDSSLVAKLKLQTVGTMRAGDGSGRTTTMDVVQLDSIAFGGLQFNNVRAPTRDYNASPRLSKIDGILGFELFKEYLLTLDFAAKRVHLQRGELAQADGAEVLRYESQNGIPVVELVVGSLKVKGRIDTGNSIGGFILPESLVHKLPLASEPVVVGMARTVSSQVEIKAARLKDTIRFGRFEFAEPKIVFPALSSDINIGSDALREFVITFDQKNNRLRLDKGKAPAVTVPPAGGEVSESHYSGCFESRTISLEDGELYLQRQGGPKLKLLSACKDEFTLEWIPEARVRFIRGDNGDVTELHVLNRAGDWEKSKKDPA